MNVSSPPLALTTRFSLVPMSRLNGAGADAVEADPGSVRGDREGLGAVAAVDLNGVDAVAALIEIGAFARVPDHPVVARLAEHLVVAGAAGQHVVAVAAEEQVIAPLAEQGVVARLAEELVVAAASGDGVVAGAAEDVRACGKAPLVSFRERLSLPPSPKSWISVVLATVAFPPGTVTAPVLTRSVPGRVCGRRRWCCPARRR